MPAMEEPDFTVLATHVKGVAAEVDKVPNVFAKITETLDRMDNKMTQLDNKLTSQSHQITAQIREVKEELGTKITVKYKSIRSKAEKVTILLRAFGLPQDGLAKDKKNRLRAFIGGQLSD
ncbi:MAG: hypothetical protein Q9163_001911 [Psora crenata]